ncbi:hypothetical protein L7F22_061692 [Adiantum nelumboides]|nr:hypothetical protein [Adiantum nelumboides]
MKRSRSGTDLHIPALIAPLVALSPPLFVGVAEANDGGADRHRHPSTASCNIPLLSITRGTQPAKFSTAAGDDGPDLIGRPAAFINPTSVADKPACRLAPSMSSSIRSDATKLSSCVGDHLPAQFIAATDYYISSHDGSVGGPWPCRSYGCSFCGREFSSAQALGGHMNIHRRDRARLRASLENLPPSTSPTAYQAAMFASAHTAALPHHSNSAILGNLTEYPLIMAPLRSPDNLSSINPIIEAPNSAPAQVSPFITPDQRYPFYYSQSLLGVVKGVSLPADADADQAAAAVSSQLPASPLSDLHLQSSLAISERRKRLMAAATSMPYGIELAGARLALPGQGRGSPDCSISRASAACQSTTSSTRLAGIVPFHLEMERRALFSSQETTSSAETVNSSGLGTRNLNPLHIVMTAANDRHEPGFSSGNLDLELRLGTHQASSPTGNR